MGKYIQVSNKKGSGIIEDGEIRYFNKRSYLTGKKKRNPVSTTKVAVAASVIGLLVVSFLPVFPGVLTTKTNFWGWLVKKGMGF